MTRALESRRTRNEVSIHRKNLLANYLIITDTEQTEANYIRGLKGSLPEQVRNRIQIKIIDSVKTSKLIETAENERARTAQYSEVWLLFDRDKVLPFDKIIEEAKGKDIQVGWSNPCIEIWFLAYFGSMSTYAESIQCVSAFKNKFRQVTGIEYTKSSRDIYKKLTAYGNEQKALKMADERYTAYMSNKKTKPSQMDSTTTLHLLVRAIKTAVE